MRPVLVLVPPGFNTYPVPPFPLIDPGFEKTLPTLPSTTHEIRKLMTLAWPIMIAHLAQDAMGFVDTLMASHAGPTELAAIALGTSIWLPVMLTLCGVLMATTPLVAFRVGADREADTANVLMQGFCVALILSVIAVLILNHTRPLLMLFSMEEEPAAKTTAYLSAISWGFPALLFYQVLRSFSEGFGRTRPIMRIAVLGMLCNIPLNYILIFGKFGLPELGSEGCGYATALVMWGMLAAGATHLYRCPDFQVTRNRFQWRIPELSAGLQYLRLGLPIGIALLIESSMFSVIALLLASHGEEVIAAHQITFSVTGLMFMIPLSLALALTIRIGQLLGAGQRPAARFSAACGIALTVLFALVNSAILLFAGRLITSAYTDVSAIIETTVTLMAIAALFQMTDAIQVSAAGALRGYKETATTLAVVFIAYWLVGLPTGHLLAERLELGVYGYWWGLLIGLSLGALLLSIRLYGISHAISLTRPDTACNGSHDVQQTRRPLP